MIGNYHLHQKVAIVCAGNLESDNAIVQPLSTALQSRLVHMELKVDVKEWSEWAARKGIHNFITSYINWKPGNLHNFQANHTDKTYPCPRTWEFTDHLLKVTEEHDPDLLALIQGTVGEGCAMEFLGFIKMHADLPKIPQIIENPMSIRVPEEPSILFALTGAISHNATQENFGDLMKFVGRLPPEFQVVCLRETVQRNKAMMGHPTIQAWIAKNAKELF